MVVWLSYISYTVWVLSLISHYSYGRKYQCLVCGHGGSGEHGSRGVVVRPVVREDVDAADGAHEGVYEDDVG